MRVSTQTHRRTSSRKLVYGLAAVLVFAFLIALQLCHSEEQDDPLAKQPSEADDASARRLSAGPDHDMDMTAGEDLKRDFAHQNLRVLTPRVSVPSEFSGPLADVYDQYTDLHSAVYAEDSPRIQSVAAQMRRTVEGMKDDDLDDHARDAWSGHRQVMRTALHQLETASSINKQRSHLSHVSEAMYCSLKSFSAIDRRIFVMHCPMAFDGQGAYWLSDQQEFQNPYMGSRMPSCGSIRETLEPSHPRSPIDFRIHSRKRRQNE